MRSEVISREIQTDRQICAHCDVLGTKIRLFSSQFIETRAVKEISTHSTLVLVF